MLEHHVTWFVALFVFSLVKAALAYLPTAHFVALSSLFPFLQVQFVQVFPLKPATFYKLSASLDSTNKFATSLLFSSSPILATLFSSASFLLLQTPSQELSSLSSCIVRLQWVPGHLFGLGNYAANKLARRGALLVPSAIPFSLSPLISTFK